MLGQIVVGALMLLGIGAWWWWSYGRHGARVHHVMLGLKQGEEIRHTFNGFFKLDFGVKDVGMALMGAERRPRPIMLTLTDGDDLVFRVEKDEPRRYKPGQFQLTMIKEKDGRRVGTTGNLEPAAVYKVESHDTEPFNISLARTAADVIIDWNAQEAA
jgi:hypothetical protein